MTGSKDLRGAASTTRASIGEADVLKMAQAYLVRRAASGLQLRRTLRRKIARRVVGSDQERPEPAAVEAMIDAVVERLARAGFIDEAALAQTRADTLVRKGLARGAIRRKLATQGLHEEAGAIEAIDAVDDDDQARRFAERKRLGPWRSERRPAQPEREIRSMVRAGFSPALARRVLGVAEEPDVEDG